MMLVPLRKRHSVGLGMLDLAFKYPPAAVPGGQDVGPEQWVPKEGAPHAMVGSRLIAGKKLATFWPTMAPLGQQRSRLVAIFHGRYQ